MPTVLITGCSSGFGLETARHFAERGWQVVATTRSPNPDLFASSDNIRNVTLDVTDTDSIAQAIDAAGPIDALVNNAGIGLLSAVEGTAMDVARALFETNTLGTIAVTQAVLPQMRQRGAGVIVNVTSTVTLHPLPLLAVYTATKAAVNALTDSMAIELEPFGIRVRTVLPGRAPDTRFYNNAEARMSGAIPEAYNELAGRIIAGWQADDGPTTSAKEVAEGIWQAVTDERSKAHIPAGADAVAFTQAW